MDALSRGVCFISIGWEETLGAIGRPQELINEDLRECDYFVLVLYDRLGSPQPWDPRVVTVPAPKKSFTSH
jgi:hypothetical protein